MFGPTERLYTPVVGAVYTAPTTFWARTPMFASSSSSDVPTEKVQPSLTSDSRVVPWWRVLISARSVEGRTPAFAAKISVREKKIDEAPAHGVTPAETGVPAGS